MLLQSEDEIKETLLGNWDWEFIHYHWTPQNSNGNEAKGLGLTFEEDGNINLTQDGFVLEKSNYIITESGIGSNVLRLSPRFSTLKGNIYFCDKRLVFRLSDTDGDDNYFVKSE